MEIRYYNSNGAIEKTEITSKREAAAFLSILSLEVKELSSQVDLEEVFQKIMEAVGKNSLMLNQNVEILSILTDYVNGDAEVLSLLEEIDKKIDLPQEKVKKEKAADDDFLDEDEDEDPPPKKQAKKKAKEEDDDFEEEEETGGAADADDDVTNQANAVDVAEDRRANLHRKKTEAATHRFETEHKNKKKKGKKK